LPQYVASLDGSANSFAARVLGNTATDWQLALVEAVAEGAGTTVTQQLLLQALQNYSQSYAQSQQQTEATAQIDLNSYGFLQTAYASTAPKSITLTGTTTPVSEVTQQKSFLAQAGQRYLGYLTTPPTTVPTTNDAATATATYQQAEVNLALWVSEMANNQAIETNIGAGIDTYNTNILVPAKQLADGDKTTYDDAQLKFTADLKTYSADTATYQAQMTTTQDAYDSYHQAFVAYQSAEQIEDWALVGYNANGLTPADVLQQAQTQLAQVDAAITQLQQYPTTTAPQTVPDAVYNTAMANAKVAATLDADLLDAGTIVAAAQNDATQKVQGAFVTLGTDLGTM
jgi:hypothetical protein